MVWIMLATLAVVFVVGFRVLTSDSRRAIKRLSERLGITPMPVESMIDQFGKTPGNEFIRYLERPDEAHLQNAARCCSSGRSVSSTVAKRIFTPAPHVA